MGRVVELPPDAPAFADGAVAGGWWRETERGPAGEVLCELCPRACKLKPGDRGFCFVRENRDGQMALTTYGRSTGFCIDPIEKKPLNHFYPGTSVLSFGTAGCNLGCRFCQNWDISKSREVERLSEAALPETIAEAARSMDCRSVAFTYNDPVIWAEYAIDVAAACRAVGVRTVAVTAGYIMPAARRPFFAGMDAANVDLKGFTEEFYHGLTASHLQPVLDTLRWLRHETDVWMEITNLVIPQANDSQDELKEMCQWIVQELGEDVPVHFTAFHPDFRMRDREATPHETLLRARQIALEQGLQFAYVGNVNDVRHQSTYCPSCGKLLIERDWYQLGEYHLRGGDCGHCGQRIAGHFDAAPGRWGRRRLPVRISNYAAEPQRTELHAIAGSRDAARAGGAADSAAAKRTDDQARLDGPASQAVAATGDSSMDQAAQSKNSPVVPPAAELTAAQQLVVRRAVRELVEAAVWDSPPQLSDLSLGGAAAQIVMGVFVTLKRDGRLRGCCGTLGRPMPLLQALQQSAARTAVGDVRMPPVTPGELPFLDMDASLLHNFQLISGPASQRAQAVQVGRHGLQIKLAEKSGLLLPVVAVEHGLDAEAFLRQVCHKAGLPSTAWQRADAELTTFEAIVFGGPLLVGETDPDLRREPLCSADELEQLRSLCQSNVMAHATGATPSYYLPNCPDGSVQGTALILAIAGRDEPLQLTQVSLRPGFPLQATLLQLTKSAAERLTQLGASINDTRVDLVVLRDAAMHGTVQYVDLRGIDPQRHAVMVAEGRKTGWVFDPQLTSEKLLRQAARQARVKTPEGASVFSLLAEATTWPVAATTAPAPQQQAAPRKPAVAGTFYPAEAGQLHNLVDKLIGQRPAQTEPAPAAMVPHAGLVYSGHIAADVLKRITIPSTVIVIGPKHTPLGVEWAVSPHLRWQIPGAELESDADLIQRLVASVPGLEADARAHAREHAIEVELPLLARLAPHAKVVGIALAGGDLRRARQLATGLAEALQGLPELPLLLISSDMNHFATDAENRRLDEMALQAMESGDSKRLLDTCREHQISMCGVFPAAIVLEALKQLGYQPRCRRVAYGTSADASGDTSRVVGYAGLLIGS